MNLRVEQEERGQRELTLRVLAGRRLSEVQWLRGLLMAFFIQTRPRGTTPQLPIAEGILCAPSHALQFEAPDVPRGDWAPEKEDLAVTLSVNGYQLAALGALTAWYEEHLKKRALERAHEEG